MLNIAEKAQRFRALHDQDGLLLLPNPWDAGSARLLTQLGFQALGTTSLGVANLHGVKRASAEQVLDNVRVICAETALPVTADLENGYAHDPRDVAALVVRAFECGAVGASIEDAVGGEVYDFAQAVERVHAAAEAARGLATPFVLTARADGLLVGAGTLDDAIARLQAFEKAGADVLYAPALRTLDEIRTVVQALHKPVNVVMGLADPSLTAQQLREVGVRRISIGAALSRLALRAFMDGAREMREGRFEFVRHIASIAELQTAFR